LFAPPSWIAVFIGQGLEPTGFAPIAKVLAMDKVMDEIRELPATIKQRVQMMPEHGAFLADYCPAGRNLA
jgi:tryptophan 7-halogenase